MRQLIYRFFTLVLLTSFLVMMLPVFRSEAKKTVIASETSESGFKLTVSRKVLYLGECTGTKSSGKKAKFYGSVKVRKLISGFNKKKYDIVLNSSDEHIAGTDNEKDIIFAVGVGTVKVSVTVKEKKSSGNGSVLFKDKLEIVVRQNADQETFRVEGITNGQVLYEGDSLIISMPGDDTDLRTVICEEDGVNIKPLKDGQSFGLVFDEAGEYNITAAAYQSKKYNGFTAYAEFCVTVKEREAEIKQVSVDCLDIIGGPVDEDMLPEDLSVYEMSDGADLFFSYISGLELLEENKARIKLFKTLESEKKYILVYDGLEFPFTSAPCGLKDVAGFDIAEDSIRAGEESELSFKYFNRKGLDITKSVAEMLDDRVELKLKDEGLFEGYLSGKILYASNSGMSADITASVEIDYDSDGQNDIKLTAEKTVISVEKRGTQFTGNILYTIKQKDDKYLKPEDKCITSVPLGDEAVFEALFEMDDGSYKTMKQAGITKIITGNPKILMIGSELANGGYSLILNSTGESGIVAYSGDKIIGACSVTVLPERKPDRLKVELSKKKLNTNIYVDDYILIKADLFDQYGDPVTNGKYQISQSEHNINSIGEVQFSQISAGRFLLYGYDCPSNSEQRKIVANVSSGSLSEEVNFYICDVAYDSRNDNYSYKLKIDGNKLIDNAVRLSSEAPKSTFVTVEISDNGYYVGEGMGYLFDGKPSVLCRADYYEVEPGENIYGISVLYTDEKGNKRFISDEEPCVISSYMELELCPYTFMERLPSGNYEFTAYNIKALEDISQIKICDDTNIRVIDSEPEIETEQLIQTYSEKPKDGWEKSITRFFSFKLDGEDISKYITKVDCVEASSGSVFVKSVDFNIPNSYYGVFTKTAVVERLITKQ